MHHFIYICIYFYLNKGPDCLSTSIIRFMHMQIQCELYVPCEHGGMKTEPENQTFALNYEKLQYITSFDCT